MVRLEELKSFVHVVERRSFSKAAMDLGLTQGSISNHVFALEKYFNSKLLVRSVKGVQLTDQGKTLYEKAKPILETVENLKNQFESEILGSKGIITIVASTIPGEHFLPLRILKFKKLRPNVEFKMEVTDSLKAWNLLKAGEVDFAAVGTSRVENAGDYAKIRIAEDKLVLIVPPDHELATRKEIDVKELLRHPYVMREEGSGTRREVEALLKKVNISTHKLRVVLEVGSTESVVTSVSDGAGISIVSDIAAQKARRIGRVKVKNIANYTYKRDFYLVARKGMISNSAKAFWDFMKTNTGKVP